MPSQFVPADVLQVVFERGFLICPSDSLNKEYVDKHGGILSELSLMGGSVESVTELIDRLHELKRPASEPDDDVA